MELLRRPVELLTAEERRRGYYSHILLLSISYQTDNLLSQIGLLLLLLLIEEQRFLRIGSIDYYLSTITFRKPYTLLRIRYICCVNAKSYFPIVLYARRYEW